MIETRIRYDPEIMPRTPFARWLYNFRARHLHLTQADFAAQLQVTLGTVQKWEYGTHQPGGPTLILLARLAHETGFEPPPEIELGRGPRIREDEEENDGTR